MRDSNVDKRQDRIRCGLIVIGFIVGMFTATGVFAQDSERPKADEFEQRWWVGATAANNDNFHSSGVALLPGDSCECGHFPPGSGGGRQLGVIARLHYFQNLAFDLRMVTDVRSASFHKQEPDALVLLPGTNEVVTQRTSVHSDVEYRLFTTDIMATGRLPLLLGVSVVASVGPSVGFVTRSTFSRWHDIESPENARFTNPDNYPTENNGRRLIYNRDSELENASSIRLSAKAGGGFEFEILELVTVRVGAYYDHGLTSVVSDHDWKINSTIYQADVLIGL